MKRLSLFACLSSALLTPAHAENLLLISVDTLRADRLSCYGYSDNRTPHFDRWAIEGALFEKAYTEVPLTLPAHSTIFTGTYPLFHGIRENVGFHLQEDMVTLAEVLKGQGYSTAAFIGSYVLASEFGMSQGFEVFDEDFGASLENVTGATALQRPASEVTDRFLAWLKTNGGKKFFAFVHFYDPHTPRPRGYDWEVSQVDAGLARIDDYLRGSGLMDGTHIVLLSDHGESLGDHGEGGHGFFVYDSTLHVPLIVRPAASLNVAIQRIQQPVSLVDVLPTLLQMLNLSKLPQAQGRSLVGLMQGQGLQERGLYAETYVPQLHFGWSPLRSLRLGRYKLIQAPRPEFYDLAEDPTETRNLNDRERTLARQYQRRLEDFATLYEIPGERDAVASLDPETLDKLAALGYVAPDSTKAESRFGTGVDPKDRIAIFESYHALLNDIAQARLSPETLARIGDIRKQAPDTRGLTYLEALAYDGLGNLQLALDKYRQALEEDPANHPARVRMARVMIRLGKPDQAEKELLRVLAANPDDYRSRNNLAGLFRSKGDLGAAVQELKRAVGSHPGYAPAWHNLGQLYSQMGRWSDAEAALRRTLELTPKSALAHFRLALTLRALGRAEEAEQHLQKAFELDPRLRQGR